MTQKPHNVNILTLDELESKEINNIIDLAIDLKKQQKKGKEKPLLQNKMNSTKKISYNDIKKELEKRKNVRRK